MKIKLKKTPRGFLRGEFKDLYGADCSIQESSLATDYAIWFGCEKGVHYLGTKPIEKGQESEDCAARMHLNQKQVKDLLPLLEYFAKYGRLPK